MNKILSTTLCFGLLTLLSVMIFLELVHGRPYLTQVTVVQRQKHSQNRKWRFYYIEAIITGNELLPDKEVTNHEELLLALLNKNFDFQRPSNIDRELANKSEELNQLEKLKKQVMEAKDAEISYAIDGLSSSHPNKRACFWKYCV